MPSPNPTPRPTAFAPWILGLALFGAVAPKPGMAQAPVVSGTTARGGILSVGLGVGSRGSAALLAIGLPAGPGEVVVRVGSTFGRNEDGLVDLGVLYGLRTIGEGWWVRYAVGPAGMSGHGLALAAQVDATVALTERFGIGVGVHGAAGGESYVGASFGIYLGWPGYRTVGARTSGRSRSPTSRRVACCALSRKGRAAVPVNSSGPAPGT